MQLRRSDFFARSLREQFKLRIKKAAIRGFFCRTARAGYLPAKPFVTTTSARVSR